MTQLHFIGGEKGGVGKSVMARVLAQYHVDRGIPFTGFDTDRSHGTFSRFYGEFAYPAVVDQYESLDKIIEAASAEPERQILVDLAAQTFPFLHRWIDDCALFELLGELGFSATFWHIMDDGKDSIQLLGKLLDRYGDHASCVIVENFGRGSDFSDAEKSEPFQRAKTLGTPVIQLSKLHDGAMHKIDMIDASFWAATHNKDLLSLPDRMRVKVWLSRAYDQLEKILPLLVTKTEQVVVEVD
ncbi:MAG TPA: hypothetical protein VM553_08310 [Dongiaceae bacterium]|nr:hypothetical protein [Dongiaceae bacterium]